MNTSPAPRMPYVIALVVTYNPDDITGLLSAVAQQCEEVVVVDNGSVNSADIQACCEATKAIYIGLGENLGIAAAQNIGIEWARKQGATHVLLMDHDSVPASNMVSLLLEALENDDSLGAVGALAIESCENTGHLVYIDRGWKPGWASAEELECDCVETAFLMASGCLIRMDVLDEIGGMNEALFVDHVDLEWGLRARNAGWKLAVIPAAHLHHKLGDEIVSVPGRAQPIHVHSPIRNYYMARNTVWLVRKKGLAPAKWQVYYTWWLAKYTVFNGLAMQLLAGSVQAQGRMRRRMLAQGLRDGIRRRMGRKA